MARMSESIASLSFDIDEELQYLHDVLGLDHGDSELQLDQRLRTQARALNVNVDLMPLETRPPDAGRSPSTVSTDTPRTSSSIASRSTSLTSLDSELSHGIPYGQWAHSRGSLASGDYSASLASRTSRETMSVSSTQPTTPSASIRSFPLITTDHLPKKPASQPMKALAALKIGRPDNSHSQISQCSQCGAEDRMERHRDFHRLPCGHILCTSTFRTLIRNEKARAPREQPRCCGTLIPRRLIEHVCAMPDHNVRTCNPSHLQGSLSYMPSITRNERPSLSVRPIVSRSTSSQIDSPLSPVDIQTPNLPKKFEWVSRRHEYTTLYNTQINLIDRFNTWTEARRAHLTTKHASALETLQKRHEATSAELEEQHVTAISDAEDKQVQAEASLRETHAQEKRDNATALKHMEAYCAGTINSTGEAHGRVVSEQDLAELEKTRRTRACMNTRHESAINVLRGEQGRRLHAKGLRQEREVQDLRRRHVSEKDALDKDFAECVRAFESDLAEKRRRILDRWDLQVAVLAKEAQGELEMVMRFGLDAPSLVPSSD